MEQDFLSAESAVRALCGCNAFTGRFGLALSPEQAERLAAARLEALRDTGRVEFGGGVLEKLIYAFCDSPYLLQETYEETLAGLQEAFYAFKNESEDRLSDDELIDAMRTVFDGAAQGSPDYLACTGLTELCRAARQGFDARDAGSAGFLF